MGNRIHLCFSVLLLSLLQACGGGGDGDAHPAAPGVAPSAVAEPSADIGTVSAKFVPKENPRLILLSMSEMTLGSPEAFKQADSGAMVSLGSTALSGSHQTVDISGDKHFALGRWVKGTVSHSSTKFPSPPHTLTGKDHESYHYLVFNGLNALPTSGKLQCTTTSATAPTALSNNRSRVGSASGSASISFDADGAAIQGSMQVRADGGSTTLNFTKHFTEAGYVTATGNLLAYGPGTALALADQGDAVPGLAVGYRAELPGGIVYTGVARFICSRT